MLTVSTCQCLDFISCMNDYNDTELRITNMTEHVSVRIFAILPYCLSYSNELTCYCRDTVTVRIKKENVLDDELIFPVQLTLHDAK